MIDKNVINCNKFFIILVLLYCTVSLLYSVTTVPDRPSSDNLARHQIVKAQTAYEEKDFGLAFKLTEIAKEQRRQESEWSVYILESALRQPAALAVGSDIQALLAFFKERQNTDVVYILENTLTFYSLEFFDYSIENLLEYFKKRNSFPEADYLLGKLYMLEGELEIAELFFTAAYENRDFFDIPDVQYDVLYSMADLYDLQGKKNNYEEVLMLIVADSQKYRPQGLPSPFLTAIISAIEGGMDVNKFFLLYRDDYYKGIKGWALLTKYFSELNLDDRALETATLFSLASLTRIDEVLTDRDIHYSYTTLQELFKKIKTFNDISTWATNNDIWEGFYLFAQICDKKGFSAFAQEIYSALALECPEKKWQILSKNALK